VARGGALDRFDAEAANRLVSNSHDAPLLELTLLGPTLRFDGTQTAIALTGADFGARLDGQRIEPGWSWLVRGGSTLEFADQPPACGARAYLAVAGGFDIPRVLGSAATDLRAGFGGFLSGRALRAGDVLRIPVESDVLQRCGQHLASAVVCPGDASASAAVRVLPGPHVARFTDRALEQFCATDWQIADGADRMGYRLVGPRLTHRDGSADVASIGLPAGAIQVPSDGQPIVLLTDHQPTGGYTVIACVVRADLGILAQRRPGDRVRFALISLEEALDALRSRRAALQHLTSAADWPGLRWA
jgi:biotin-dependent carboxylase-like uncharacterized protein